MLRFVKGHRVWLFLIVPLLIIGWFLMTDPDHGADTVLRIQMLAWGVIYGGIIYLFRKSFIKGDSALAWEMIKSGNIAAAIWAAGVAILTGLLFLGLAMTAHAEGPPEKSLPWLPVLQQEAAQYWRDVPLMAVLAAQPEQETCPTLTARSCWSPYAGFKTSREEGIGLGQITITARFDNLREARKLDKSLEDWTYDQRYDGRRQLRAMILMDKGLFARLKGLAADQGQQLKMTLSSYNGGLGGLLADRRLCNATEGCKPTVWDGNVERYSLKSKVKQRGYGKSFFDINREYVANVTGFRADHYRGYFGEI